MHANLILLMAGHGKQISPSIALTASSRLRLLVSDLSIDRNTFTANGIETIETNTMKNKMNRLMRSSQRLYTPRMIDIYVHTGIPLYHSQNFASMLAIATKIYYHKFDSLSAYSNNRITSQSNKGHLPISLHRLCLLSSESSIDKIRNTK